MKENLKILLVEDDVIMAMDMAAKLERIGHTVVSVQDSGESVITFVKEHARDIDLILMDVLLNGNIDGIDTNQQIMKVAMIPTIILTGFSDNNTVQRAKMPNIIGYIVKPCTDNNLKITIELGLYNYNLKQNSLLEDNVTSVVEDANSVKYAKISLWAGEDLVVVNVSDICFLEISDGVVTVQTDTGVFYERGTLKEWEERLAGRSFFRCHKSFLININKITRLTPCMDNTYLISLSCCKKHIPLSRNKLSEFHSLLLK